MTTFVTSIIGGGVILLWYIYKAYRGYLQINLQISNVNGVYTVRTQVENVNEVLKKNIANAFLLITLEENDIVLAGKLIAREILGNPGSIKFSNDFGILSNNVPIYLTNNIGFIPLTFYYDENIGVNNEKLTYTCSIDQQKLQSGRYSVRFFIFPKQYKYFKRHHISTQDLLIIS